MTALQTPRPAAAPDAPRTGESIALTVLGTLASQGSKKPLGTRTTKTGKTVGAFTEDDANLRTWRTNVANTATAARDSLPWARRLRFPLDGPLAAEMVFTLGARPASRPGWWQRDALWSKQAMWRPASKPDLSKLLRAVEDALTGILWRDDARVVEYDRLAKYYVGDPAPNVLDRPGVFIRIRQIGGAA